MKISKSGIAPHQVIKSDHLLRIINALDGTTPNSEIEVNGSVTASSFIGDGSEITGIVSSSYSENTKVDYTIISGSNNPITSNAVREGLSAKQSSPTGFIEGLPLSIKPGDDTKGLIGTGSYIVTDYTDINNIIAHIRYVETPIEFTPQYMSSSVASYIALDLEGDVVQSASPFDNDSRRTLALIGATIHSNHTTINAVNEIKAPILADTNQLHDFMKAIGSLNINGNIYFPTGSNLNIHKTSGEIWGLGINAHDFGDPHRLFIEEQTTQTFRYRLRDVSFPNGESADTTNIDPNFYDLNGVKTAVPSGSYTTQHITLFQSGDCIIQYGQTLYSNLSDAKVFIQTQDYIAEANVAENGILRTYLIVKSGTTSLTNSSDCEFIPVDKFGNVVGGAGVSLTYSTIISGLGYTPENVLNKQNNFTPDGTGQKYATIDVINSLRTSISSSVFPDTFTKISPIIPTGSLINIGVSDFIWRINQNIYTNTSSYSTTIATASADYNRIDIIVANTSSYYQKIQGTENSSSAVFPTIPSGTLLVTSINVFGSNIASPTPPSTVDYILKSSKSELLIPTTGVINTIEVDEISTIRFTGASVTVPYLKKTINSGSLYDGKEFTFIYQGTGSLTFSHSQSLSGSISFYNGSGLSESYSPNEIVKYRYSYSRNRLESISRRNINQIRLTTSSSITTLTTSQSIGQHGKNVILDNGASAINLTTDINSEPDFVASYLKHGASTITFLAGSGSTLISVDNTSALTGAVGSTATLSRVSNAFYLRISNA